MSKFYTYLHCKPNGDIFYVGKGCGKRAKDFVTGRSEYHKRTIDKYGKSNILVFIFPCDSEDEAFSDEMHQISQLRRDGCLLCNMTAGGEGISGFKHSEASIELMRKKQHKTSAQRLKISVALTGRKASVETKAKQSAARLGKSRSQSTVQKLRAAMTGRPKSAEHRAALSAANKKAWEANPGLREKLIERNIAMWERRKSARGLTP